MGMDLVSLAEYKAYANLSSPNQDVAIKALIPKVSELVKNYCGRTFIDYVEDPKIEYFNGGKGSTYFPSEYPILSIHSLEVSVDGGSTYTELVEYTDFAHNVEDQSIVSLIGNFEAKKANGYKLTYSAGFEDSVVPEDLKLAVMDLITYYLRNDQSVHSPKAPGTNSVQIEYVTLTGIPSHIRRILDLYKGSWI